MKSMRNGIFLAALADATALGILCADRFGLAEQSLLYAYLPAFAACVVLAYTFLMGNKSNISIRFMWLVGVVVNTSIFLQMKSVLMLHEDTLPTIFVIAGGLIFVLLYLYTEIITSFQRKRLIRELHIAGKKQGPDDGLKADSGSLDTAENQPNDDTATPVQVGAKLAAAAGKLVNETDDKGAAGNTHPQGPIPENDTESNRIELDKRRLELLGLKYPDTDSYGTLEFTDVECSALESLINEGFLPAHQRLGDSQIKIQELYNFMRDHKTFHACGLVSDAKSGASISVNAVEGTTVDDEETLSFLEQFRLAKEYWRKGTVLYAYFA